MNLIDVLGSVLSLTSTYFFIQQNTKAWVFGLLATLVNGWLYWQQGIFADAGLEAVYFISMIYGNYIWREKKQGPILTEPNTKQWGILGALTAAFFICIQALLQLMHSNVAFLDAATTALSLLAQGLMCHKVRATWVVWFVTDSLYAFMYYNKHLPFHVGLMLVYSGMAMAGYFLWGARRSITEIPAASTAGIR